jgi:multidrug resistance efflux pump
MTWMNRLKLAIGLVVTLAIVAAGTLVFTQRQHRALSATASIAAESYPVGTDYGGIVTRQHVTVGDEVSAGDPLFEVHSLQLRRDIASGYVVDPEVIAGLGDDGTSTIVATVDGTVASVAVPQGGFAQAGAVIATLDRNESLFVVAEFVLSARDYARIVEGAPAELLLPDQETLTGTVADIDVDTVDGQARSTVRIESAQLAAEPATGLFQSGTPVSATIRLRDDGPLAGVSDAMHDLLRKIGL